MTDVNPTVAQMSQAWGVDAVGPMIELAVYTELKQLFFIQPISVNDEQADIAILRHPRPIAFSNIPQRPQPPNHGQPPQQAA